MLKVTFPANFLSLPFMCRGRTGLYPQYTCFHFQKEKSRSLNEVPLQCFTNFKNSYSLEQKFSKEIQIRQKNCCDLVSKR